MSNFKKLSALVLSVLLALMLCGFTGRSRNAILWEMLRFYGYHQEKAAAAVEADLAELKAVDPEAGVLWQDIMDYWKYTHEEMELRYDLLDEALEDTNKLCIVVMGYELDDRGGIQPELEQRLYTALACAVWYPDAYVLCTGGGTALENPGITEAGQMAAWLVQNGISKDRILVEDRSFATSQNVIFTYELLRSQHPEIDKIAIVSSDYHIGWASVLFEAYFRMHPEEAGQPAMHVVTHAACRIPEHRAYPFAYQAAGLLELAGMPEAAMDIYYLNDSPPKLP